MIRFTIRLTATVWLALIWPVFDNRTANAQDQQLSPEQLEQAVERALPLLEISSAETARQRQCFTCHGQAMPIVALIEAKRHGFVIDSQNLQRQLDHTYAHLDRSKKLYQEGKGTGGQVDTAGWALWGLEAGKRDADEVTDAVIGYLKGKQDPTGVWKCASSRPPSEKSDFATSYLALRALDVFGNESHTEEIAAAKSNAKKWLESAKPLETEDFVFQLLTLPYVELDQRTAELADHLQRQQRVDGGWAQLPELSSDAYATATVLYALAESGMSASDPAYRRGLEFLVKEQQSDGSWHVKSRSKPFQLYFETGYPHGKDQFISMTTACWATLALLHAMPKNTAPAIETLTGTQPLEWPEADLSGRMMIGAHRFIESRIKVADGRRREMSIDDARRSELRKELQNVLGVVEQRISARLEQFGEPKNPAIVSESATVRVIQVRWPVFANVFGEGLWVQQKEMARGCCIIVPDADQSPEQLLGLAAGLPPEQQIAARLAAQGFDLLIPAIISRDKLETEDARTRQADMTQREWIYRQAFHMGRHVIGYDVQRILGAADWFAQNKPANAKIGIIGYGEGGLLALHAAAIDPRIDVTLISGYFNSSEVIWSEPIYRNVWRRSLSLGNAEVAALIMPRPLLIEHSEFPLIKGHKGDLSTPTKESVRAEFERIRNEQNDAPRQLFVGNNDELTARWSDETLTAFLNRFDLKPSDGVIAFDSDRRADAVARIAERKARCVRQAEEHVQSLVQQSEHVRDKFFLYNVKPEWQDRPWSTDKSHAIEKPETFIAAAADYRKKFSAEAMGQFDLPLASSNARTRKVSETDLWTAYDVVLDVHDSLFAWGTLVVPKNMKPEERRPVVVCQHGRNGVPRDTIDNHTTAYNDFAAKLAERGFVTYAPHNLYRGEDQYRWLDRKANAIGCTLFSFIIAQHDQTLTWLSTLPFVDGDRIAFYGLSYGGETAVRVPPVLEKYCLSICSGDFNQWTRKVASTDQPFSFMRTIEWEMPYWNLGHTFDYAEMTYLMLPRPFMVERGHHDGVGRDQWVAHEFAKVRFLYAQFGMSDRVDIEFFQGGHSINGQGTFDFLHKHLNWPAPDSVK
jgi:dienelactone hydrolase